MSKMEDELKEKLLSDLNESQKSTVEDCGNNLYITACPGSGKTRALTRKIAYLHNLYPNSMKKIVAITYTGRAAEEIQERLEILGIDSDNVWVGTVHQFCLNFILKPFSWQSLRISRGIRIIDEYVTEKYLKECAANLKLKYDCRNKPNLKLTSEAEFLETDENNLKLAKAYHRKLKRNNEIDFELILTLSLSILLRNPESCLMLSRTIRSIYVDEFQDTTEEQYRILSALSNSNHDIKYMFVGDADQAIYTGLGGVVKTKTDLEEIMPIKFFEKTLDGCYRSTQDIIDYYSKYQQQPIRIISKAEWCSEFSIIRYNDEVSKDELPEKISDVIRQELDRGVKEEDICIASPNYFILFPLMKELKMLLPDVNFRSQDIYPIKPDDLNLFYKISFIVFTTVGKRVWLRKKIASEIIDILKNDYGIRFDDNFTALDLLDLLNSFSSSKNNGLEYLKDFVYQLFIELNIDEDNSVELCRSMREFFNKAQERIENNDIGVELENFRNAYDVKRGVNVSTIHKIKGEEYNTVIGIGLLKGYIPNWNNVIHDQDHGKCEAKKTLYVLMSRAKKSLYLFSETGRVTASKNDLVPTEFLS